MNGVMFIVLFVAGAAITGLSLQPRPALLPPRKAGGHRADDIRRS